MDKLIISGNLLWPDGQIRPGDITIEGKKITRVSALQSEPSTERPVENGAAHIQTPDNHIIAPGFIDLHINGAFGHDFTSNPRQITAVARNLPRFGITAFLPTLISAPLAQYQAAGQILKGIRHEPEMAAILGLHLEGPYLNRAKAGAHAVPYLRQPDKEELMYFDSETIRFLTLSPELPGALPFIRAVRDRGIMVGIGHSTATYDETLAAADAGAVWGTHIFNGMGMLHHRHPGIVGALLTDDRLRLGLIADRVHIHPAILRLVAAAKKASGVTLVSNAIAAAGMPLGDYPLGNHTVSVESNSVGVRMPNGTLAGSLDMLDQAVRNMVHLARRPIAEVLQMASQTPAALMGLTHKGNLAPGCDADIVILDDSLQVKLTMIQGQVIYQQSNPQH
ncbi:MAG: N-acetylglucosamine-6-phosphate deacetylase [Candidatus Promineifilaceae bacterium]